MNLFQHINRFKKLAQEALNPATSQEFDRLSELLEVKVGELIKAKEAAGKTMADKDFKYLSAGLNALIKNKANGNLAAYWETFKNLYNLNKGQLADFYMSMSPFFPNTSAPTGQAHSGNLAPKSETSSGGATGGNMADWAAKFQAGTGMAPVDKGLDAPGHVPVDTKKSANAFMNAKAKLLDQVDAAIGMEERHTVERPDKSSYAKNLAVLKKLQSALTNLRGKQLFSYLEDDSALNLLIQDKEFAVFNEHIDTMIKSLKEILGS